MPGSESAGKSENVVLHVEGGAESGAVFVLENRSMIGRGADADHRLSDKGISGRHLEILLSAGGAGLLVLSSQKTVIVNDEKVSNTRLFDGDVITLPPYRLTFNSTRPVDRQIDDDQTVILTSPTVFGDDGPGSPLPPEGGALEFQFDIFQSGELVLSHTVVDQRIIIGRGSDCDIRLNESTVSRQHAEITHDANGISIKRLSTTGFLVVNGEEVETALLQPGDTVEINPFSLRLGQIGQAATPEPAAPAPAAPEPAPPGPVADTPPSTPPPALNEGAAGAADATRMPETAKTAETVETGAWLALAQSERTFALREGENLIGRADHADVRLEGSYVSREHAVIILDQQQCLIRNRSQTSRVEVQGVESTEARLYDGDTIKLDDYALTYHSSREQDRRQPSTDDQTIMRSDIDTASPSIEADDKTIMMAPETEEQAGAKLLLSTQGREGVSIEIATRSVSVGRSDDCDVQVDDPMVSRRQLHIVLRDGHFIVQPYPDATPVKLNGEPTGEARLYNGDQIQMGSSTLDFLSTRDEDKRETGTEAEAEVAETARRVPRTPAPQNAVARKSSSGVWLILSLLILGGLGYFGYTNWLIPWQHDRQLDDIDRKFSGGPLSEVETALNEFTGPMAAHEVPARAREYWVKLELLQAAALYEDGKLNLARDHTQSFLDRYGMWPQADTIHDNLDRYYFELGKQLVADGKGLAAVRELSAVSSKSEHFEDARKLSNKIWQGIQKKRIAKAKPKKNNVAAFLRKGDAHFQKKEYLTPAAGNAYGFYSMVLEYDPRNTIALSRIQGIKDFYFQGAEAFMTKGKYKDAVVYFQRYLLIDPTAEHVSKRLAVAKAGGETPETPGEAPKKSSGETAGKTEKPQPTQTPVARAKRRNEKQRARLRELGFDPDYVIKFLNSGQVSGKQPGKQESPFDDKK